MLNDTNKKPETALADAFEQAGFSQARNGVYMVALKFVQAGGTRPDWISLFDQADAKVRSERKERAEAIVPTPDKANLSSPLPAPETTPKKAVPTTPRGPTRSQIEGEIRAKLSVLDTTKTSDGRAWGDVGYHELFALDRDGEIARRIHQKCGVVPEDKKFAQVRELIRADMFAEILKHVGANYV